MLDPMKKKEKIKIPERDEVLHILKAEFGSIDAAAGVLKISTSAIYLWQKVPPARAIEIEGLTHGRVRASRLRPDLLGKAA